MTISRISFYVISTITALRLYVIFYERNREKTAIYIENIRENDINSILDPRMANRCLITVDERYSRVSTDPQLDFSTPFAFSQ